MASESETLERNRRSAVKQLQRSLDLYIAELNKANRSKTLLRARAHEIAVYAATLDALEDLSCSA